MLLLLLPVLDDEEDGKNSLTWKSFQALTSTTVFSSSSSSSSLPFPCDVAFIVIPTPVVVVVVVIGVVVVAVVVVVVVAVDEEARPTEVSSFRPLFHPLPLLILLLATMPDVSSS